MKVVFYQRKPRPGFTYSLESYFEGVREHLPPEIQSEVYVAPRPSEGVFPRVLNVLDAPRHQGDVNHITGDIHYASYLLTKAKTILTVHDCGSLHRLDGWRRELLRLAWYDLPARRVSAITVNSTSTRDDLLRFIDYPVEKIHVIPVFISGAFEKAEHNFNAARPRILHVGTTPNKNLFRLLEALAGVPCHLVVIGGLDPAQVSALSTSGVEYSNRFALSEDEMVKEYVQADLVSFPSTFEGFGMPILEANAVGRPVLSGNVMAMPETAGDAACLVDPFNVASIRAGFLRLIESPSYRETLVANGYRNARRFSPQTIAEQYRDLYRQVHAGMR